MTDFLWPYRYIDRESENDRIRRGHSESHIIDQIRKNEKLAKRRQDNAEATVGEITAEMERGCNYHAMRLLAGRLERECTYQIASLKLIALIGEAKRRGMIK